MDENYIKLLSDTHLMVDIETGSTNTKAEIESIGAVKFDVETGIYDNRFYRNVDVDSGANEDRKESEDTMQWWEEQEAEFSRDGDLLCTALNDFKQWLNSGQSVDKFWAKSPEFDIMILKDAYSDCGIRHPFRFFDNRDVRTIYDVGKMKTGTTPEPNRGTVDHNALNDAIDQALGVLIALRTISENRD